MHGLPTRAGANWSTVCAPPARREGVDIVCNRRATTLFADGDRITGVEVDGPDGPERIGCDALILACNGFGGNREMVARFMPEIDGRGLVRP
jgi:fumarate reductase flavoprotein subunit